MWSYGFCFWWSYWWYWLIADWQLASRWHCAEWHPFWEFLMHLFHSICLSANLTFFLGIDMILPFISFMLIRIKSETWLLWHALQRNYSNLVINRRPEWTDTRAIWGRNHHFRLQSWSRVIVYPLYFSYIFVYQFWNVRHHNQYCPEDSLFSFSFFWGGGG